MPRVVILMYHSISLPTGRTERDRRYSCPPERFEAHLEYLKSSGRQVVSLDQCKNYLETGKGLDRDSIVITFDDGFRDNYDNALPLLRKYRYPATVFVAVGYVPESGKRTAANRYMSRDMLDWGQLQEMHSLGVAIGAHTVNHPKLPEISAREAREEITASKCRIEDRLQTNVRYFAYPYGLYDAKTRELVAQAGFALACSTRSGFNRINVDPYALRRIEVYGADPVWKLSQKLTFGITDASVFFPFKYYAERLGGRLIGEK